MNPFLIAAVVGVSPCGVADDVFTRLQDTYGEVRTYSAVTTGEAPAPIVVTISSTGSWTMLMLRGELACVLAGGEKWGGALRSPSEGPLPAPEPAAPPMSQPHWPPQWPDGLCPCGNYVRGIGYEPD